MIRNLVISCISNIQEYENVIIACEGKTYRMTDENKKYILHQTRTYYVR
jgi:hypothetical protein